MDQGLTSETRSLRLPLVGTLGLALLAIVAVALVFNRTNDSGSSRREGLAAGPDSSEPVDDGSDALDDDPTGFYVPGDLPDGWTVQLTELTNPLPERCPCTTTVWRHADGPVITSNLSRSQERFWLPDYTSPVDRAAYREIPGGYVGTASGEVRAKWLDGEFTRRLSATGVDAAVIEETALAWTGDGPPVPPVGFEHVWTGSTPDIARSTGLYWRIRAADDRSMLVHITPWLFDEPIDPEVQWPGAEPVVLPGNGTTVTQVPGWSEPHMEGFWPGRAHVTVAGSKGEFDSGIDHLSADEMRVVAGGFRPVGAEEWAAYVEAQIPAVDDPETYDDEAAIAKDIHVLLSRSRLIDLAVTADEAGPVDDPGVRPTTTPSSAPGG